MWRKLLDLICLVVVLCSVGTNVVLGGIVIERRISTSSDDVEERLNDGSIDMHSSDLEMPYENPGKGSPQMIGLRFQDVTIPKDAVIKEAWLQFEVDEDKDALPVSLLIEGELTADPVTFTEELNTVSSRPRTNANVRWSVPSWTTLGDQGPDQRSTDITAVIEEIIAQEDWAGGNALVLIVRDDPDNPSEGVRTAESYSLPTGAPLLHVEIFGAIATQPDPPSGARSVTPMLLEWTPGDTAALHEVYFGTNPTPGPDEFKGRQPSAMLWLGPTLVPGTTYYWRVDEVDADGATIHTGEVWSFTTTPLTAHRPHPSDGANWMGLDVDLNWAAGLGALLHDVYFGTDPNAVGDGTGDTFKGSYPATTYDPGTLAENTTYYWRVDEIEEDMATRHPGDLWQFTTAGPGGGIKAQYYHYSGGSPPAPPESAFETLVLTRTDPQVTFDWGNGSPDPQVNNDLFAAKWTGDLEVAFSEPYMFSTNTDDGLKLWVNGRLLIDNWTLHGATIDTSPPIELAAGPGHSVEMWYFENSSGALAELYWQSPSTPRQLIPQGAMSLPLRARNPNPADEAVDVAHAPILRWKAGDKAVQHQVYFGADAEAVAGADPTTAETYRGEQALEATTYTPPGSLEWNKTYYWRIDEVNTADADSPWKSRVWSFTTADFIVVDDFESYTNDVGHRVFEKWVDGIGFTQPVDTPGNGTGASVGHDIWSVDGPHYNGLLMETEDVHGGYQAMPLYYDNSAPPYRSEAQRTYAAPQDWTLNGVDTLVLYIRGDAANDAAPLYVVVEDSGGRSLVVTHPDNAIVTATEWTEWQIPMADFADAGVVLAAVRKMCLGVGSRDAAAPDGTGALYFDDLRVVRSQGQGNGG
ncbi:MAG: hypothetical protein JW741_25330 [Sedimentisphaerales bacterium]|nr:hypothetical protein [Sedimentisphaerales bacterium]